MERSDELGIKTRIVESNKNITGNLDEEDRKIDEDYTNEL